MNCECGHSMGQHQIIQTGDHNYDVRDGSRCQESPCVCHGFRRSPGPFDPSAPAPEPNEINAEIEAVGDICRALEPIGDHRIHVIRAAAAFYGIDLVKRGSE